MIDIESSYRVLSRAEPTIVASKVSLGRDYSVTTYIYISREKTEFCGACFDCRREGEQESRFLKNETHSCSSRTYTRLQYKKQRIEAAGTTFYNVGDEVGMEDYGTCRRLATLTGVHQETHFCLAK